MITSDKKLKVTTNKDIHAHSRNADNFTLNNKHVIFYNKHHIWSIHLDGVFGETVIEFNLDEKDISKSIKEIRVNSNSSEIAIIVQQSMQANH